MFHRQAKALIWKNELHSKYYAMHHHFNHLAWQPYKRLLPSTIGENPFSCDVLGEEVSDWFEEHTTLLHAYFATRLVKSQMYFIVRKKKSQLARFTLIARNIPNVSP